MKNFMLTTARAEAVVAMELLVRDKARCSDVETRHHMFVASADRDVSRPTTALQQSSSFGGHFSVSVNFVLGAAHYTIVPLFTVLSCVALFFSLLFTYIIASHTA